MAAAIWSAATGRQFSLNAIVLNTNQYPVDKIAVSVQEDFRKLGINMQIDTLESAALKQRWQKTFDWDLNFYSRILFAGFSDYGSTTVPGHHKRIPRDKIVGRGATLMRTNCSIRSSASLTSRSKRTFSGSSRPLSLMNMNAFWFGFPRDLILGEAQPFGIQPNAMWQYWDTWKLWRTT